MALSNGLDVNIILTEQQTYQLIKHLSNIFKIPTPHVLVLKFDDFKNLLENISSKDPRKILAFHTNGCIVFRPPITLQAVLHEFRHYMVHVLGLKVRNPELDAENFVRVVLDLPQKPQMMLPVIFAGLSITFLLWI